ncbi:DUF58 domain-containing protein [Thalassoglobus polymorphus]|uniref:DUF58 domain-containing protein n=1 Tax=Thalassoglobus polymorphus TaxID=2527994 RepID=A0A517QLC6_9PLAN|nr:DUF58 domain-containing protein [Thalassoglobus polymorphus]QDT32440.1 hypothetical protein Mal48_16860 [Thalassoglobus polymorphus]
MRDFIDPKVVSRLAGLPLDARIPMIGSVSGRHRSPTRGSSLEFSEYRKYVPGDDTRRLDWRAWGRSDRFYIKEYEADTNLRLCPIVDVSGSMNYGIDGTNEVGKRKIDYARQLAGTLAYLAAFQGDAVGLYCAGTEFKKEIPPKRSGAHLRHILDELGEMEGEGETGLAEALHSAAEKIAQRALIVIISDLFLDTETLKSCFQHLRYRKHDVAVFHLLEQNEIDFQFDRPVRFVDLEGAGPMLVDPTTIAKQYRAAVQQYLEDLSHIMKDSVVDYHRVGIEEDVGEVLAKFLLARKK